MEGDPSTFGHNPAHPRSRRVMCSVCGRTGEQVWGNPKRSWQEGCMRGHAPCPDCGKALALKMDGTPRRHARCPRTQ